MNNVIPIGAAFAGSMTFTEADKKYLSDMTCAFSDLELPHELVYGLTDEGQEWCLVRKLMKRRNQNEWHNRSIVVAEIVVTSGGYQHKGNWGDYTAHTLQELFAELMPPVYDVVYNDVQKGVV